jgi:hypothetical protein
MPQVMHARLEVGAVPTADADVAPHHPEVALGDLAGDGDAVPPEQVGVRRGRAIEKRESCLRVEPQR